MYEDLIKRLRNIASWDWNGGDGEYVERAVKEAADAIEEMRRLHEAQRQNLITLMNEEPEPE